MAVRLALALVAGLVAGMQVLDDRSEVALDPLLGTLVLATILVEASAVRLPAFGFCSHGFALVGTLALAPTYGPRTALFVLLISLALRTLIRPASTFSVTMTELLLEFTPTCCALACLTLMGDTLDSVAKAAVCCLVFLVLAGLLPNWLAPVGLDLSANRRMRLLLDEQRWGTTFLAPFGALFLTREPLGLIFFLPVLWALRRSAVHAQAWLRLEDQFEVKAQAKAANRELDRVQTQLDEMSQALEMSKDERRLFEECGRGFAKADGLTALAKVLDDLLPRLIQVERVALFVFQGNQLRAISTRRAHSLSSSLVEECWGKSQPVVRDQDGQRQLALPLHRQGVLAVAKKASAPLAKHEAQLLELVAEQTMLGMLSARRFEQLKSANRDLAQWNTRLSELVVGTQSLAQCLTSAETCSQFQQFLLRLVPEQKAGRLRLEGQVLTWPEGVDLDRATIEQLEGRCRQGERLMTVEGSLPLVLGVPLEGDSGSVFLFSEENGLGENHARLLETAVQTAGLLLSRLQLFEQLHQSEAQLVQAEKLAAVGQLAAGVAHEVNNPLGSIRLAIEATLREKALPKLPKTLLEPALQAVLRVKQVVSALLSYSRVREEVFEQVDLQAMVEETILLVRAAIREAGVEVVFSRQEAEVVVRGNPSQLQQVLMNLLFNARDAVCQGDFPRQVRVSVGQTPNEAFFEVEDQGPGVPPELASRIFDPFFTTKEVGQGTGLGLSVSAQLVEAHEGRLEWIPVERGALFRVSLPPGS